MSIIQLKFTHCYISHLWNSKSNFRQKSFEPENFIRLLISENESEIILLLLMIHFKSSLRSNVETHNQNVHPSSNYVLKRSRKSLHIYTDILHTLIHLEMFDPVLPDSGEMYRAPTTLMWDGDPRGTYGVFDHILNKILKHVENETNCRPFKILNVHSLLSLKHIFGISDIENFRLRIYVTKFSLQDSQGNWCGQETFCLFSMSLCCPCSWSFLLKTLKIYFILRKHFRVDFLGRGKY